MYSTYSILQNIRHIGASNVFSNNVLPRCCSYVYSGLAYLPACLPACQPANHFHNYFRLPAVAASAAAFVAVVAAVAIMIVCLVLPVS